MTSEAASERRAFAALEVPGYRMYLVTFLLTMMADNIEHVISYWLAFQKFHSPALAGFLPAFPALLRKQTKGAVYPAARAILSAAVEGASTDFDTASRIESRYLTNLIINAFEAMDGLGAVTITATVSRLEDGFDGRAAVCIEVADDGPGMTSEIADQVFAQTQQSDPLRSDAPVSMRNGAIFMGAPWHWQVWGDLRYSVQTGKPAWGKQLGGEVFDFFAKNPEASEIFNNAMTDMSVSAAQTIVDAYDFSGIKKIADIGVTYSWLNRMSVCTNPWSPGLTAATPMSPAAASTTQRRAKIFSAIVIGRAAVVTGGTGAFPCSRATL